MIIELAITILSLLVLLFSVIIHELAHGCVAYSLGDPTAKYAGRLTLNPLKHLDMWGSIILPIFLFLIGSPFLFGWAKPVPINPYNFKDQKHGEIKVSFAGPAANLSLALVFGLIMRFVPTGIISVSPGMIDFLTYTVSINIWLAIFNLIPVPPLDGSWILFNFLPDKFREFKEFSRRYGMVIILALILFAAPLWFLIISFLFQTITGYPFYG